MTIVHSPAFVNARFIAGFAAEDTPCRPSRSAYMDDELGEYAFARAMDRWSTFVDFVLSDQDSLTAAELDLVHAEGHMPRCDDCGRSDNHEHRVTR